MDTQRIEELVDLKGKAAVVTGGGKGIGQAIAMALADVGAAVMIADRNLNAAYRTIGEIREMGGYAEAIFADACSADDARNVIEQTCGRWGAVDILINAAATFSFSPALTQIHDLWERTLSTYVKGVAFYSQAAAQKMIQAGRGGRIVNVASIDAMRASSPYADNPFASVAQLTKSMAVEFGTSKINVNAVASGLIRTPGVQMQTVNKSARSLDDITYTVTAPPALERVGTAEEIATVVLFLVSDAGEKVTGNLVTIG